MVEYDVNDKVVFQFNDVNELAVVTNVRRHKNTVTGYDIRSEKGSGYSLVPVDKRRRKGTPDYPVIDSAMTVVWNKAVEKGEAKETNLFAKEGWGHTRANFSENINLRFDGDGGGMGHLEKKNDFVFPTQGPRSF